MKEEQLIFLSSLPRSGSTLTQRILGSNPDIATTSEPWIMLPLLNLSQEHIYEASYGRNPAATGVSDFLNYINEKDPAIVNEAIKQFALTLYSEHLGDKAFFLDKTPRYYLIANELETIFPNAKHLYLIRDPLAVLVSIYQTWVKGDLNKMINYQVDLIRGVQIFSNIIKKHPHKIFYYEDLLQNQESTLNTILSRFGIPFEQAMLEYRNPETNWNLGDQQTVNKFSSVQTDNLNAWINHLEDPILWNLCAAYLNSLGQELYSSLGYTFQASKEILENVKNKFGHTPLQLEVQGIDIKEFFYKNTEITRTYFNLIHMSSKDLIKLELYEEKIANLSSALKKFKKRKLLWQPTKKAKALRDTIRSINEAIN